MSFNTYWFDKMQAGKMIYEYRKRMSWEEVTIYFFVSLPVKAIVEIAHFAKSESLEDWLGKI